MTRHKDRKTNVRARMAATGEPYSVAARAVDASRGQLADLAPAPGRPGMWLAAPLSESVIQPVPLPDELIGTVPEGTTASRCACGESRLHYPGDRADPWKKHFDYCLGICGNCGRRSDDVTGLCEECARGLAEQLPGEDRHAQTAGRYVWLPLPGPAPYPHPCPECGGTGVTGDRFEVPASKGAPVLVVDVICPECAGCGNGDPEHATCPPEAHAYPEAYLDEGQHDVDSPACYSCGSGRGWNPVRSMGEGGKAEGLAYLRMPCGCAEGRLVAADDPAEFPVPGAYEPEEPEPEPEEYDPGSEVDDEGGMSEYRHARPDDPF